MKIMVVLLGWLALQQIQIKEDFKCEKKFEFGLYTVLIGSCPMGSMIVISYDRKTIFELCKGDGKFVSLDTTDINNDTYPDFVFSYAFDDYSNIGILVSRKKGKKYDIYSLLDGLSIDPNCSVEPFQIDDKRIKDFVLFDMDNDGHKDILTIAIRDEDRVIATNCSKILTFPQIQKLITAGRGF